MITEREQWITAVTEERNQLDAEVGRLRQRVRLWRKRARRFRKANDAAHAARQRLIDARSVLRADVQVLTDEVAGLRAGMAQRQAAGAYAENEAERLQALVLDLQADHVNRRHQDGAARVVLDLVVELAHRSEPSAAPRTPLFEALLAAVRDYEAGGSTRWGTDPNAPTHGLPSGLAKVVEVAIEWRRHVETDAAFAAGLCPTEHALVNAVDAWLRPTGRPPGVFGSIDEMWSAVEKAAGVEHAESAAASPADAPAAPGPVCGATTDGLINLGSPIGPCVLETGHADLWHQDERGTPWRAGTTMPEHPAGAEQPMVFRWPRIEPADVPPIALRGCDDCSVEPGEHHRYASCPGTALKWLDHRPVNCDGPSPTTYPRPDGSYGCRCIVCERCHHHAGDANQGHYWLWCKVTKTDREFHFCCPNDCALEAKPKQRCAATATVTFDGNNRPATQLGPCILDIGHANSHQDERGSGWAAPDVSLIKEWDTVPVGDLDEVVRLPRVTAPEAGLYRFTDTGPALVARSCPTCHSIGTPRNGCGNAWHNGQPWNFPPPLIDDAMLPSRAPGAALVDSPSPDPYVVGDQVLGEWPQPLKPAPPNRPRPNSPRSSPR
jgi:hypothetical protein